MGVGRKPEHKPKHFEKVKKMLDNLAECARLAVMNGGDIKRHRQALGLTQPEFAKRLKVSHRIVTKWERDGAPVRWDELIHNIVREEGAKRVC